MDIASLQELRTLTGWGLTQSKELLSIAGGLPEAKKLFLDNQKRFLDYVHDFKQARNHTRKGGWWISEFISRPPPNISANGDPILKQWAVARKRFEDLYNKIANEDFPTSIEHLRSSINRQQSNGEAAENFQSLAWHFAANSHIVPRFEPDWLQMLKQDPFEKLRMLTNPATAELELDRCAVFPLTHKTDTAVYMAQSLRQAEQYFIAARSVEYTVRPLLLFYAATNLARAILSPRLSDFKSKYGAHGLKESKTSTVLSIADYSIVPTSTKGLFHAIDEGLPGSHPVEPNIGPWSLLDLCRLIPELADTLDSYEPQGSNCAKILDYNYHVEGYQNLPYNNHLGIVLRASYIIKCGLNPSDTALAEKIRLAFPSDFWVLGSSDQDSIRSGFAPELQEQMYAFISITNDKAWRRRIYPLIHQGALDGNFYVVYNNGKPRPHQFLILFTLLYGLSMLVRYKPVEWSTILASNSLSRALIEQILHIAAVKLPILATEELLSRRILGSLDTLPK